MASPGSVRGRRVTVPVNDPTAAAVILSRSMSPDRLDDLIRLLLATPDLAEPVEDAGMSYRAIEAATDMDRQTAHRSAQVSHGVTPPATYLDDDVVEAEIVDVDGGAR